MRIILSLKNKITIAILVLIVVGSAMNYFSPIIGAELAVNQLQDDYTSNIGVKFWGTLKNSVYILYIIFVAVLFKKEIFGVFSNGSRKEKGE